ncbi:MAG: lysoplasmalogenase [Pleurocapsa minor GSE-CHR-MK-17-07R]|jgi:hypothetical protein|nr:lysoplasmalogenase [Pleurocapsa minor GSE-CHR-MK 17-07R]
MNTVSFAEGPRDVPVMILLGILWLGWAALLFGGFLLGKSTADDARRMPVWARLGSSFVLVGAAWAMAFFASEEMQTARGLIALGMTLGAVGDIAMARRPPRVVAGMALFGLGHIAYIAGFANIISAHDIAAQVSGIATTSMQMSLLPLIVLVLVSAATWFLVVYRPTKQRGALRLMTLPYGLLLACTAGIAFAAGDAYADLHGLLRYLPALGAILFLLSDLLLAAELFNRARTRGIETGDAIWLLYGPGQMLIVYASLVLTIM